MDENLQRRLERHGEQQAPTIDADFADRLESHLRAEHARAFSNQWRQPRVLLPRVAAAVLLAIAGLVGIVTLGSDDALVPVAVIDDEPLAPLDGADLAGSDEGTEQIDADNAGAAGENSGAAQLDVDDEAVLAADPTAVPTATAEPELTPTPVVASPTPTQQPVEPAPSPTATVDSTVVPAATPVPVVPAPTIAETPAEATAVATATVEPAPTPSPAPTATSTPAQPPVGPTPAAVPTATATATAHANPTPVPSNTAEPELAGVVVSCEVRVDGDAVGVACEWQDPGNLRVIVGYEVLRSREGATTVVSRQRASAPLLFIDRDIDFGDQVAYLVQGLDADGTVVASSGREVLTVPDS